MAKTKEREPISSERVGTVTIDGFGRLWDGWVECIWYEEYHPEFKHLEAERDMPADDFRLVVATKFGPVGVNAPHRGNVRPGWLEVGTVVGRLPASVPLCGRDATQADLTTRAFVAGCKWPREW